LAVRRETIRIAETTIATEPAASGPQFAIHDGHDGALPPFERALHRIFLGPDGLRPIWRLAAAVALYNLLVFVIEALLATNPAIWAWMRTQSRAVLTPGAVLFSEGIRVVAVVATGDLMRRIENRSLADYGLPLGAAFGKRFWQGAAYGFTLLTVLMASIAGLGGFSLGRVARDATAAIR